ncbi:MAG TPA: zinc-dependent metalloprotease family protein [Pyrinomonadaceae bacterium]
MLDKSSVSFNAALLTDLRQELPRRFEIVSLDQRRLRRALELPAPRGAQASSAPAGGPQQQPAPEVSLPLPDGTFVRFSVQESPVMEPELARQFPELKTYRGQGIEDPSMTARFDMTPAGFHAIVLSPDRTFYIDPFPLRRPGEETYMTFFKADGPEDDRRLRCLVGEDPEGPAALARRGERRAPVSNGETLRTYRLAVAATGEYTKFHGGTVAGALRAIVTTVNRVNAIYENDLAISLRLVGGETRIIYTDPDRDPYTNLNAPKLIDENQQNLDAVLGDSGYDIGHVFSRGGGGLAAVRSVGQSGRKARGATGSNEPRGDAFDVDYVAHEMGHQFGANHTFNATTESCNHNRNPTTAYEPGSGSTLMAYAGICGQSDLQRNSDSYFHGASLEEILTYVTSEGVSAVPRVTPTNNRPPSVVAGQRFVIPKGTPFKLEAVGTDADGDAVTFCWEQFDLGKESPPDGDADEARPIFRSFGPSKAAARFFPQVEGLLSGRVTPGETLPARARLMSFRVTARDNRAGGGGVGVANATVSVVTDSGPFDVTGPAAAATWTVGTSQVVTWDVAGTSEAPVSCGRVRLSLSTDGGKTYTVLMPSTPNTGGANVTVPNTPTARARIMVEAVDNAFFDVSPSDFSIVRP